MDISGLKNNLLHYFIDALFGAKFSVHFSHD